MRLVTVKNVTDVDLKGEFFGHGFVDVPAGAVVTLPLAVADAFNSRAGTKVLVLTEAGEPEDEERKTIRRKRGE